MVDVVVVGAGISGLTLAYKLKKAGKKVKVIESSNQPGGWIESTTHGDNILEFGPNSVLGKPCFLQLCEELGVNPIFSTEKKPNRYIFAQTLKKVPGSPLEFIHSDILTNKEKLRIFGDLFAKRCQNEDESIYSFITRHFGEAVAQKLVAPLFMGVWGANIKNISARSALAKAWELEQSSNSVIRGLLLKAFYKSKRKTAKNRIASFQNGLQELPLALANYLGPDLLLNEKVSTLSPTTVTTNLQSITSKQIVLTTDHSSALQLVPDEIKLHLAQIKMTSIGVTHAQVLDPLPSGFGFLAEPGTTTSILGMIFSSQIFEHVGNNLVTIFHDVSASERDICEEARHCLSLKRSPKVLRTSRYSNAIPLYEPGHWQIKENIDKSLKEHPWLRLNLNSLSGISVPDRIDSALQLADELLAK